MQGFLTNAARKAALNRLTVMGGILNAATLILITGPTSISKDTVFADVTEATFDGYAAVAAQAFSPAYVAPGGAIQISAPSVLFTDTGNVTPNTVTGWALVDAGKTTLYYVEKFDTSIVMDGTGEGFLVQPVIKYGD